MIFHDYIKPSSDRVEFDQHDKLLRDLITAMREDLFSNKEVNSNYPEIHLTGNTSKYK